MKKRKNKVPRHVGVIQDGNRRYAIKHALTTNEGHFIGADISLNLVEWIIESGVKYVTLYTFSTENFKRGEAEIDGLHLLFIDKFTQMLNDKRIFDNKINVKVIGDKELIKNKFSQELLNIILLLEESTAEYDNYYLRIALAYGGQLEIQNALKSGNNVCEMNEIINGDVPDVDLVFRTANDYRTSNFLTWSANGSEALFYVCKKLFPELCRKDWLKCLKWYQKWKI